jgi:hypothetical protein
LGLVIALAIVASLAKTQLHAIGGGASTARNAAAASESGAFAARPGGAGALTVHPGAVAADLEGATVPEQARSMQERARADTVRALQQGVERNRRADP